MEEIYKRGGPSCLKVVLFGPESTGKSTLAQQLAQHYESVFVPEYSRIYTEMQLLNNLALTKNDVMKIAEGQIMLETQLEPKANKILFCDTDVLETKVYSEMYYDGYCPPQLEAIANQKTCDLYLLTYIDLPWVADTIRDKPQGRKQQFYIFEKALITYDKPYEIIKGNENERLQSAINYVDTLLKRTP